MRVVFGCCWLLIEGYGEIYINIYINTNINIKTDTNINADIYIYNTYT